MDPEDSIRQHIREARNEKHLSQAELARLFPTTQATISDIERGKVQLTIAQLIRFAQILQKPLADFLPNDLTLGLSIDQAELLEKYKALPDQWRKRALYDVQKITQLYQRIKPYVQAGVPEEFYGMLIFEEERQIQTQEEIDAMDESAEPVDYMEFYQRFRKWRDQADAMLKNK
jgi:transcriptional regulator with XRE-family HTH domain